MSTTLWDLLDDMYYSATSERDKGTKFERFLKSYLQTEPKYADLFSDVWLWQEWPERAKRPDTGIDLVAQDRYTGEYTAIQAKFYDPSRALPKAEIDSFFTELGKHPFTNGMIITTTQTWSKHAEAALNDQSKPIQRIDLHDLAASRIDWSLFDPNQPEVLVKGPGKEPRKYQREAIDDVVTGFTANDRGKLIMACGTGKTFTSLKLVEEFVPIGGSVLFLVPSIALLQQTLNEWTAQADKPLRAFAVCSDVSVGRREHEDVSSHDLGFPATTDANKLFHRFQISNGEEAISVIFSTYQSIDVIHRAQELGLPEFDLVICDEAHRTTGISQPGSDDSAFVSVHNQSFLKAKKRLYMTATPRIYIEDSKQKAAKDGVAVFSMDEEDTYGPEFHHLGFGRAVEMGHLSDYKVLILAVDEESVATSFQDLLAREGDMNLDDVARIVGCWNGLSKRGVNGERLSITDTAPMQRAVAFARNIKESKAIANQMNVIGRELLMNAKDGASALALSAQHVDGTFNVLERSARLDWLQAGEAADECRILTNAKCLTEGVDVPSLDAVLFLNPRNSQVDVVQAVGRVMRRAAGKEYGYIILPIAVPASQDPETALNDNKKYKVVWDVLQALRAHDDRFEAMVNKLGIDKKANNRIDVIGIGGGGGGKEDGDATSNDDTNEALFSMVNAAEWQDAIFARMVKKVGDRRYWEDWASDVKDIADRQVIRIKNILDTVPAASTEFEDFHKALQANLNDGISRDDAVDMLVQHLITKPVFDALFEDYAFSEHNPVSVVMDRMLATLDGYHLESETSQLEDFYRSVRVRAEGVSTATGKQKIVTELYERFFKLAFPRVAESLGIVYTPMEIVDFILRAVNDALKEHFGASIGDEGVHVLDPFTGTGTFIVRLMQSGLIDPQDLLRKFTQELHANEILLMAYYIAAINIEATFHALQQDQARERGEDIHSVGYEPFNGIVLTDTFQMSEDGDALDELVFTHNNDRVVEQNALDIRVIVGNPPYSAGQSSENDNNANLKYPSLDSTIRSTYARFSNAVSSRSTYDSYVRAIRWASNKVLSSHQGGVVSFVSNGGYIDDKSADGLRRALSAEFHHVYVYNLRGNQRTAGELSRKEGGKIFDSGSRNTVAIILLVKLPGSVAANTLHYHDIGDYLTREEKLDRVNEASLATIEWRTIVPNPEGDWVNQRDPAFEAYAPISDKLGTGIFQIRSLGLTTNRDSWAYNSSLTNLTSNMSKMVESYNNHLAAWVANGSPVPATDHMGVETTKVSWSRRLRQTFTKGIRLEFSEASARTALYRPFQKLNVYYAPVLNEDRRQIPRLFPSAQQHNHGFHVVGTGLEVEFSLIASDLMPDLQLQGNGQFFARYSYTQPAPDSLFGEPERVDNITDWALGEYQREYGAQVTKDNVFFYVYGLLHSPEYRKRYASDLKKQLPRIPMVPGRDRFEAFADAGRKLSELHIGYEGVEPYPLTEVSTKFTPSDPFEKFEVKKMRYGGKAGAWDKTRIVYNSHIDIEGIPEDAQRYMLGSRSALDWIVERYQVKTDKASGIVNDPNDWSREHDQPRYIIDLIGRIVTVSIETMKIVDALPDLGI
ncbi:type ISP restriction/modification enzyme [Microbacterium sp. NPDC076911]|uniref:DEAD/DEAH box helicase n=1 Tax=Microbacterium sp. NPDC076911 TaxID=3154958 RepID=UPI003435C781